MTDELQELDEAIERIVPQDLSEWPAHAQAQHLQLKLLRRQVANLAENAAIAKTAAKAQAATVADHERRLRFIEALLKWALGLLTAIATGLGVTWIASGGKHL